MGVEFFSEFGRKRTLLHSKSIPNLPLLLIKNKPFAKLYYLANDLTKSTFSYSAIVAEKSILFKISSKTVK